MNSSGITNIERCNIWVDCRDRDGRNVQLMLPLNFIENNHPTRLNFEAVELLRNLTGSNAMPIIIEETAQMFIMGSVELISSHEVIDNVRINISSQDNDSLPPAIYMQNS